MEIQRFTEVRTALGTTQSWVTHIADYEGVIDLLSGEEILGNQNIQIESSHILVGPVADIKEGDKVLFNGYFYDVKYVDNPMNLNKHLEITLKRGGVIEV